MSIRHFINRLKGATLFKDSFWAVFGNGFGSLLLLFAGILIARFLGRDVYGEYGVVKTNMFYLAGFSTFGLGLTSTRFIAKYLTEDATQIRGIISTACKITLAFSGFLALFIVILAKPLAGFLNSPEMVKPFRYLSFIIVVKALGTTTTGILAGLGVFKTIARNAIISGLLMVLTCVPLTYYCGLEGSLIALSLSQVINMGLNFMDIRKLENNFPIYYKDFSPQELIKFSVPIALQEISYSICNWTGILALTKLSSMGEVGLYSASAQWNAVILFIPGLLSNVVLSHLSRTSSIQSHKRKIRLLLGVYLSCTTVPFIIVFSLAHFISTFYGSQFAGMASILQVLTLATIPLCCSDVFKSELLALGKTWTLFTIRCCKDVFFIILVVTMLLNVHNIGGAMIYAIVNLVICTLFFIALMIAYSTVISKQYKNENISLSRE